MSAHQLLIFIRFFLSCCLVLSMKEGASQTCTPNFEKYYGGNGNDEGLDITATADGGSIVAGRSSSDYGNYNGFMLKLTDQGKIQWIRAFGGSQYDDLSKVRQTAEGGYIAAGTTKSFDQNNGAAWIVRTDPLGNLLWSMQYRKNGASLKARDIIQLKDGGYALAINTNDSTAQGDGIILRLSPTGIVVWSKRFDSGGRDGFNTLLEDGEFLLVSGFSTGDFLDGNVTKLLVTNGAVVSSRKYIMRSSMSEEVLNIEKISGGYAVGMVSKLPQMVDGSNRPQLTFFKLTENDSVTFVRKANLASATGYAVELVKVNYTRDSGFAYIVNDTLAYSNGVYKKVGPSGMQEWARENPSNFQKRRINGLGLYGNQGYLYTGTVGPLLTSADRVQVLKTDNAGRIGNCRNNYTYNIWIDTTTYSITPFIWSTATDEPMISAGVTASLGSLNFTETSTCGKTDCTPAPVVSDTACFATFLSHYKGPASFTPLDVVNTGEAYYVSGYIQHLTNPEPVVMRVRLNGTVDWTRSYNNLLHSSGFTNIRATTDGNLIASGSEYRLIGHIRWQYSTIVKLSPTGDVLWARELKGNINDLHPCGNGEYMGVVIDDYATASYYTHFFKINEAGEFTYQKFINPRNQGFAQLVSVYRKVLVEGPSTIYAAGENPFNPVLEITRFDTSGKRVWTRPFSYNNYPMNVVSFHTASDTLYTIAKVFKPLNNYSSKITYMLIKVNKNGQGLTAMDISSPDFQVEVPSISYEFPYQRMKAADMTVDNKFLVADRSRNGSDSVLTVVEFGANGETVWGRRYPNLKNHVATRLSADSLGILLLGFRKGTNSDLLYQFEPLLMRMNDSGKIQDASDLNYCRSESLLFNVSPATLQDVPAYQQLLPYFESWLEPKSARPIRRDFTMTPELGCGVAADCSMVKIRGLNNVCNYKDTIVYKVTKNPGCVVPAVWSVDTSLVKILQVTDTSLLVHFRRYGAAKIFATLRTGCGLLKDSVTVAVQYPVNTLDLGADTTLCPGNTILLNAHKGHMTYLWQDGSTDSTFAVSQPGMYYVTVSDVCGKRYTDSINVLLRPPIPFSISPDRTKCNQDTIQFTAPAGFMNYTWSPQYNISSTTQANVVVNPKVDTTYYVKAEKTPGCFAYDTIRVKVFQSPPINLGPDRSFCSGDSATLDAGAGFDSYLWNGVVGNQHKTVYTIGTYRVHGITKEGCRSSDTAEVVNVWALPRSLLNKDSTLCTGSIRNLSAGNFISYLWQDGSNGPTYTVNGIGTYTVQVTDNHGCMGSDTVRLTTILPLPSGFLPADTAVCSYGTLNLSPLQSYPSYLWSTSERSSSIRITKAGVYWLDVQNQSGCTGRDTIIVNPKECITGLHVPTAFTPNRDGKNDSFRAMVFGNTKRFELAVYNRWGQVVFFTTDPSRGWDGKVAGINQETGVFVWTCRYQLEGGKESFEKGTVSLIR